jgi:hypothetical protein
VVASHGTGTLRGMPQATTDFLFRIISSMIAIPRDGDPREFLHTYVVPALVESR